MNRAAFLLVVISILIEQKANFVQAAAAIPDPSASANANVALPPKEITRDSMFGNTEEDCIYGITRFTPEETAKAEYIAIPSNDSFTSTKKLAVFDGRCIMENMMEVTPSYCIMTSQITDDNNQIRSTCITHDRQTGDMTYEAYINGQKFCSSDSVQGQSSATLGSYTLKYAASGSTSSYALCGTTGTCKELNVNSNVEQFKMLFDGKSSDKLKEMISASIARSTKLNFLDLKMAPSDTQRNKQTLRADGNNLYEYDYQHEYLTSCTKMSMNDDSTLVAWHALFFEDTRNLTGYSYKDSDLSYACDHVESLTGSSTCMGVYCMGGGQIVGFNLDDECKPVARSHQVNEREYEVMLGPYTLKRIELDDKSQVYFLCGDSPNGCRRLVNF